MKPDRYTKAVLTIIAAALVWLCVRDEIPTVQARASQDVVTLNANSRQPVPVMIVGVGRTQWTEKDGPFKTVQHALPWEPLEVITR